MTEAKSISLYFNDGSSDKEYHAQLQPKAGKWVVTFQYGRRGNTLTSGTKTPDPLDYDKAVKAYDKIVKEKMGKGYSTGEAGAAFQNSDLEQRFTGIVPQLLNPIDESEVNTYLDSNEWGMEEKHDGHRREAKLDSTETIGVNRKGLVVPLPKSVVTALEQIKATRPVLLDGELMGEAYALFDVLEANGRDLRNEPYAARYAVLEALAKDLPKNGTKGVYVTRLYTGSKAKREFYGKLKADGKEGAVFKRLNAPYTPGRPNSGGNQLKRKFTYSATFMVSGRNATKRSVSLVLFNDKGEEVSLGNVTIPANYDMPSKGFLVEVEYLYAYPNGALAQPQYKGERDDLEPDACTLTQLKYKATDTDEDEA